MGGADIYTLYACKCVVGADIFTLCACKCVGWADLSILFAGIPYLQIKYVGGADIFTL